MASSVPIIDLAPWFGGDEAARAAVAAQVDAALQSVGFFLASGHVAAIAYASTMVPSFN